MPNFHIRIAKPEEAAHIIGVYIAVGWGTQNDYVEEDLQQAMQKLSIWVATVNEKIVGVIRVLSDNVLETHILDVAVKPDQQRKGIAHTLMVKVAEEYSHTAIYAKSTKAAEGLFAKVGLKARDDHMTVMAIAPQKVAMI